MNKVFISYSSENIVLAKHICNVLSKKGVKDVFLAELSLKPSDVWDEKIRDRLIAADYVFFLASATACKSAAALQEIGGTHFSEKTIISFLIGITPKELPGFLSNYHVVDIYDDEAIKKLGKQVGEPLRREIATEEKRRKDNSDNLSAFVGGAFVGFFSK